MKMALVRSKGGWLSSFGLVFAIACASGSGDEASTDGSVPLDTFDVDTGPDGGPGTDPDGCLYGYTQCDEICIDTDTDENHCGDCDTVCAPDNASGECTDGTCGIGACTTGYGDCNEDALDGCETVLDSAPNCGACGETCERPNAVGACVSGECVVDDCGEGFLDCDGDVSNGCERGTTYYDGDGDGYGDHRFPHSATCMDLANFVSDNTDCDDDDATQLGGDRELCDDLDNDCDGLIDESLFGITHTLAIPSADGPVDTGTPPSMVKRGDEIGLVFLARPTGESDDEVYFARFDATMSAVTGFVRLTADDSNETAPTITTQTHAISHETSYSVGMLLGTTAYISVLNPTTYAATFASVTGSYPSSFSSLRRSGAGTEGAFSLVGVIPTHYGDIACPSHTLINARFYPSSDTAFGVADDCNRDQLAYRDAEAGILARSDTWFFHGPYEGTQLSFLGGYGSPVQIFENSMQIVSPFSVEMTGTDYVVAAPGLEPCESGPCPGIQTYVAYGDTSAGAPTATEELPGTFVSMGQASTTSTVAIAVESTLYRRLWDGTPVEPEIDLETTGQTATIGGTFANDIRFIVASSEGASGVSVVGLGCTDEAESPDAGPGGPD